jgi:hypothetical protein
VTLLKFSVSAALALALVAAPRPAGAAQRSTTTPQRTAAAAQTNVTSADIVRLQDSIADASRDVAQLRNRDSVFANDLQTELDDVRDEATYLKVKLRHNEAIRWTEYTQVRDRITNIRTRASGDYNGSSTNSSADRTNTDRTNDDRSGIDRTRDSRPAATTGRAQTATANEIPVGTEFDVSLQTSLSSATAQVEDRFEATTMVDLMQGNRVLVPAGSVMRGVVSSVVKATRLERKGALTVAFDRVTISGRSYPIRATVTQALESEGIMGEKEKIGAGAGVGAIIGGILGGFKGAMAGILIGGGGTIAATEGKDVELAPGTTLRVRMDAPLVVR